MREAPLDKLAADLDTANVKSGGRSDWRKLMMQSVLTERQQQTTTAEQQTEEEPDDWDISLAQDEIDSNNISTNEVVRPFTVEGYKKTPYDEGKQIYSVPVSRLKLSDDVKQFKKKTRPLNGEFDQRGVAPILVYLRNNGALEVISGRHRYDLAKKTSKVSGNDIPIHAQIYREDQGFTPEMAGNLDRLMNLRDGQGDVEDYIDFFRNMRPDLDYQTAAKSGLVRADSVGEKAYTIARGASDNLVGHVNDPSSRVDANAAYAIVNALRPAQGSVSAPSELDAILQNVAISRINSNESVSKAIEHMQVAKSLYNASTFTQSQLSLFGGVDETLMNNIMRIAKRAADKKNAAGVNARTYRDLLNGTGTRATALKNAATPKDSPDVAASKLAQFSKEFNEWSKYYEDPELLGQLQDEVYEEDWGVSPTQLRSLAVNAPPELQQPLIDAAESRAALFWTDDKYKPVLDYVTDNVDENAAKKLRSMRDTVLSNEKLKAAYENDVYGVTNTKSRISEPVPAEAEIDNTAASEPDMFGSEPVAKAVQTNETVQLNAEQPDMFGNEPVAEAVQTNTTAPESNPNQSSLFNSINENPVDPKDVMPVEEVNSEINRVLQGSPASQVVRVVDSEDQLPPEIDRAELNAARGRVSAVTHVIDGKPTVFILRNNVARGQVASKILHELGVHIGIKNSGRMEEVSAALDNLRGRDAELVGRANQRVQAAMQARGVQDSAEVTAEERVAHFVEEAVLSGINPTQLKPAKTGVRGVLYQFMQTVRAALRKAGIYSTKGLTPQDIVNLAHDMAKRVTPDTQMQNANGTKFSVQSNLGAATEEVKGIGSDLWNAAKEFNAGLMTPAQIASRMEDKMPSVRSLNTALLDREATKREWVETRGVPVAEMLNKLSAEQLKELREIAHTARRLKVDPRTPPTQAALNIPITPAAQKRQELIDRYNDPKNEAVRQALSAVWKYHSDAHDEVRDTLRGNRPTATTPLTAPPTTSDGAPLLNTAPDIEGEKTTPFTHPDNDVERLLRFLTKIPQPYTPFSHAGKYYVVGMSQEVADLVEKQRSGTLTKAEFKELLRLQKDKAHYSNRGVKSLREERKTKQEYKGRYAVVHDHLSTYRPSEIVAGALPNLDKIALYLTGGVEGEGGFSSSEVNRIKAALEQAAYDALPEHSALKRNLHSKDVHGESEDFIQTFHSSVLSTAQLISQIKHARAISDALSVLRSEAKTDDEYRREREIARNEIERHLDTAFDNADASPILDKVNQVSYISQLAMSPAFLMTQVLQVPMISLPWLGARMGGMMKVAPQIVDSGLQAASLMKVSMVNGVLTGKTDWSSLRKDQQAMLEGLKHRNLLMPTSHHDFGNIAAGGSLTGQRFMRNMNSPTQIVEETTRVGVALAAYDLHFARYKNPEKAARFAEDAVHNTMFDYSPQNTARHMRRIAGSAGLARVVFQFQKFRQGMLHMLFSNIKDAANKEKSPEARAEALRTLGGVMATTTLAAGAFHGTAFMSSVIWAINAVMNAAGDDDDPYDFETSMRNVLHDIDPTLADVVAKGLPALLGVDLSQSLGAGNLLTPLPFVREGDTGRDQAQNHIIAALGAPTSMAVNMWDGITQIVEGDVVAGLGKAFPAKGIKSIIQAYELGTEGQRTREGETRIPAEDISTWDVVSKGLGIRPMVQSDYYDATGAINKRKHAANAAHTKLIGEFARRVIDGEDTDEVLEKIKAFNNRHRRDGTAIHTAQLFDAIKARRRNKNSTRKSGVLVPRSDAAFAQYGRFAEK